MYPQTQLEPFTVTQTLVVNFNLLPPETSHLCIASRVNKSAQQTSGGFPNSFEFLYKKKKKHPVNKHELR